MSSAARPHSSRCMGGAMVMGDLVLLEGALRLAPCFGAVECARAPRKGCSPMAIPLACFGPMRSVAADLIPSTVNSVGSWRAAPTR